MDLEALARAHREAYAGHLVALRDLKPSIRDFARHVSTQRQELAVVGELRRVDPDLGPLGEADPAAFARAVEEGGGYAVSVCCESPWGGALEDVARASEATQLPVLARGIVLDEQDLYRLRASGADAAVVHAALHPPERLARLRKSARSMLMEIVVEAENEPALSRAIESGCPVIAVPGPDLALAGALLSRIPAGRTPLLSGGRLDFASLTPLLSLLDAVILAEPVMAVTVESVPEVIEPFTRAV